MVNGYVLRLSEHDWVGLRYETVRITALDGKDERGKRTDSGDNESYESATSTTDGSSKTG